MELSNIEHGDGGHFKKPNEVFNILSIEYRACKRNQHAYGSGVNAIATLKPKGIAPCINMGLRRRLAKHFVVADTPEHFTSKICSVCHCNFGPFESLEIERRKELLTKASTEEERKKARRYEIRGIRRCQNAECGVILNRDRNGATNIATNFSRRYCGEKYLREFDAEDIKLQNALQV